MHVYVQHVKDENVRFEVLEYDAATKQAVLKGEYGAKFTRDISKEALKKYGYQIVKSEKELPLCSARPGQKPKPGKVTTDEEEE